MTDKQATVAVEYLPLSAGCAPRQSPISHPLLAQEILGGFIFWGCSVYSCFDVSKGEPLAMRYKQVCDRASIIIASGDAHCSQQWLDFCSQYLPSNLNPFPLWGSAEIHVKMAYALPSLPYEYTALEPHIDAMTMNIHHTKHHQTYVNNLNGALDKFPEFKDVGLVDLNKMVGGDALPKDIATVVRNNGGGHWNHSFFWKVMTAPSNTNGANGDLKAAIEKDFGSLDEMKAKFNGELECQEMSGFARSSPRRTG